MVVALFHEVFAAAIPDPLGGAFAVNGNAMKAHSGEGIGVFAAVGRGAVLYHLVDFKRSVSTATETKIFSD